MESALHSTRGLLYLVTNPEVSGGPERADDPPEEADYEGAVHEILFVSTSISLALHGLLKSHGLDSTKRSSEVHGKV
jgi:hypothetical protein